MKSNADMLRGLWVNEVAASRKAALLTLISQALDISVEASRLRMIGRVKTNDAEFIFLVNLLREKGINIGECETEFQNIKRKYQNGYTECELQ